MNTTPSKTTFSLSTKVLIALGLGSLLGFLLSLIVNWLPSSKPIIEPYFIHGLFELIKQLFMNALRMMVVPLVLVSLVCGTCTLSDPKKLGSLGIKSILLYLLTTTIAISIALLIASLFQSGTGIPLPDSGYSGKEAPSLLNVFAGMVTDNPFKTLAQGNMLQLIVFAILLGISISWLTSDTAKRLTVFFNDFNELILKMVTLIMHIAPYGVFCIMAAVVYQFGWETLKQLGGYFALVISCLILHASITYSSLLILLTQLNPYTLFQKMKPALLFAFSTSSSSATLPVTLEVARKRLGIGKTTASFTLPLGATINMDGTAIMQGVATVFIAQMYGVDLTSSQYLTIILMATLMSIGTAGVPGAGLIMLSGVLAQVGLPADAIGILLGIDRLLDMTRTAINITGDATVACIVSKSENDLDETIFNDMDAGSDFEHDETPGAA